MCNTQTYKNMTKDCKKNRHLMTMFPSDCYKQHSQKDKQKSTENEGKKIGQRRQYIPTPNSVIT